MYKGQPIKILFADGRKRKDVVGDNRDYIISEKTCTTINVTLGKDTVMTDENSIKQMFSKYGRIRAWHIIEKPVPSIHIQYFEPEEVQYAIKNLSKSVGAEIKPNYENQNYKLRIENKLTTKENPNEKENRAVSIIKKNDVNILDNDNKNLQINTKSSSSFDKNVIEQPLPNNFNKDEILYLLQSQLQLQLQAYMLNCGLPVNKEFINMINMNSMMTNYNQQLTKMTYPYVQESSKLNDGEKAKANEDVKNITSIMNENKNILNQTNNVSNTSSSSTSSNNISPFILNMFSIQNNPLKNINSATNMFAPSSLSPHIASTQSNSGKGDEKITPDLMPCVDIPGIYRNPLSMTAPLFFNNPKMPFVNQSGDLSNFQNYLQYPTAEESIKKIDNRNDLLDKPAQYQKVSLNHQDNSKDKIITNSKANILPAISSATSSSAGVKVQTLIPTENNKNRIYELDYSLEDENMKVLWSGDLTKSGKDKTCVIVYQIRNDVSELFDQEINLNIKQRTLYEDIVRRNHVGMVVLSPQNDTQCEIFDEYIKYFNEKQRVGVIYLRDGVHIMYIVPPCEFSKNYYINPKKYLLGVIVSNLAPLKTETEIANLTPPPIISMAEKKLTKKTFK